MYKGHTSETDFKTDLNNPIFKFTEGSIGNINKYFRLFK